MTEPEPLATAQQLGESFAALVGQTDWQLDAIPESDVAETAPVDVRPEAKKPPLAQAAHDATVPPSPLQIVEAMLFVGGPPLTAEHAAEAIRGLSPEDFRECIEMLNRVYRSQNRPYAIVHGTAGYVMRISSRFAGVREKLYGGPREARLTQPALDVLSLVAYRQPLVKAEIDAARGNDSGNVLRQLVRLGLIATADLKLGATKETTYSTTPRFLEVFRLRNLEDLPQLGETVRIG